MISHKAEDGDGLAEFTIQRTSFFVTVKVVEYCEGSSSRVTFLLKRLSFRENECAKFFLKSN